jgi:hypothetical protein
VITGAKIDANCFGTTIVLPAKESEYFQSYDYRDTYLANTLLLRIGYVAFLAVLDDSCASAHFFSNHLKRINAPLSPIQLREVLSHLTLLNSKLKYRPSYYTVTNSISNEVSISANLPERMELENHTRKEFGEILYANVSKYVENIETQDKYFNADNIRNGMYHFLFDENGEFIKKSLEPIEIG